MTTAKEARLTLFTLVMAHGYTDDGEGERDDLVGALDAYAAAVERETEARWRERLGALAVMLVPTDDEAEDFCDWRQMAYDQARAWADGVDVLVEGDQ